MDKYSFYKNKESNKEYTINSKFLFPHQDRGSDYKPSDGLIAAVDLAILLQKPLLITGEPGTGKSELAFHLATHFGWGKKTESGSNEPHFFATRTDSVANDLLYQYNSLAHFNKVNISKNGDAELEAKDIDDNYITPVALGQAIIDSSNGKRSMVLIDEIDKAPRDLPNDILSIIETMSFEIPELKAAKNTSEKRYKKIGNPELKPVVVFTSNSEKTLPEAFLRRCVFFHIEMPNQDELTKILLCKKSILSGLSDEQAKEFTALFWKIRKLIVIKKPATHELILWVWWMRNMDFLPKDILQFDKKVKSEEQKQRNRRLLSLASILAKDSNDWKKVNEAIANKQLDAERDD